MLSELSHASKQTKLLMGKARESLNPGWGCDEKIGPKFWNKNKILHPLMFVQIYIVRWVRIHARGMSGTHAESKRFPVRRTRGKAVTWKMLGINLGFFKQMDNIECPWKSKVTRLKHGVWKHCQNSAKTSPGKLLVCVHWLHCPSLQRNCTGKYCTSNP